MMPFKDLMQGHPCQPASHPTYRCAKDVKLSKAVAGKKVMPLLSKLLMSSNQVRRADLHCFDGE